MKAVGARLPRYDGLGPGHRADVVRRRRPRPGHALGEGAALAAPLGVDPARSTRARRRRIPASTRSSRTRDVPKNVHGHLEGARRARRRAAAGRRTRCATRASRSPPSPPSTRRRRSRRSTLIEVDYEEREPLFDMRKAFDPESPRIHPWARSSALRAAQPPPDPQGRRRVGVRRGRRDRPGRLPARRRSSTARSSRRSRSSCPRCTAGSTIYSCTQAMYFSMGVVAAHLEWPLNKLQVRRRDRRRRLRRQGRHGDRDDLRAARAQGPAAGQVALDARGGVPRLVDARALAHGDRGRGHERRLDPRPADDDAARRRRVHALLVLRADEARVPPHGRVHDPEPRLQRLRRLHEPRADDGDARLRRHLRVVRGRDCT